MRRPFCADEFNKYIFMGQVSLKARDILFQCRNSNSMLRNDKFCRQLHCNKGSKANAVLYALKGTINIMTKSTVIF